MKKVNFIVTTLIFVVFIMSGCSQMKVSDQKIVTEINEYVVNNEYNSESMRSITDKEYVARGNQATLINKATGVGITMPEEILAERKKEDFKTDFYIMPQGIAATYTTDKAKKLFPTNEAISKMTDDELNKLWDEIYSNEVDLFSIIREDKSNEDDSEFISQLKERFSNVEKLVEFDGYSFYFGYNDDISNLELTDEETIELNGIINQMNYIKENLCIFKSVNEEDFFNGSEGGTKEFDGDLTSFTADTVDGQVITQDFFKDYDITMVNVWATWCGYCIDEMPDIQKLFERLPENINIISICTDGNSEKALVQDIVKETKTEFKTLVGNEHLKESFYKYVDAYPTTVFVDSKGNIVGEIQVGVPGEGNAIEGYTELINNALKSIGKEGGLK